jgi:two-component system chemotaxis response regulator CheY
MGLGAMNASVMNQRPPTSRDIALEWEYVAEYCDHLAAIRTDLLALAKGTVEIDEDQRLHRILRAVHSVRGARFFGFEKISDLAQKMEDVLVLSRSQKTVPKPYQVGILLLATDRLRELLENSGTSNQADIGQITGALGRLYDNSLPAAKKGNSSMPGFHSRHRLRTLVVDDDLASRLLLTSLLSRYGDCDVAVNGKEAVDAFRSTLEQGQKYDLICMDILMPEMDGREALRQMRALEETDGISPACGVKIVIMTAIDDAKEMIGCFEDFSDAYLTKPVNLINLLRHLRSNQLLP